MSVKASNVFESTNMKLHILGLILLATANTAGAADVLLGGGKAYGQEAEDGIYYQKRFRHDLKLEGEVFNLGLTNKFDLFGKPVRWRVFGVLINGFRGDADAVQDEHYAPRTASGCIPEGCGDFSRYRTEFSTRGVAATLAPEFNLVKVFGRFIVLSPEAGVHVYMPRLDEEVYTLDSRAPAASHRDYHYKWGLNAGEVFGVGAEWGNVRLAFRRYKINLINRGEPGQWKTDVPSSIGELVNTVTVEWRVPL